MQIAKGSTGLRRLKFGMCDVLVALQNRTLPFFEIFIFGPDEGSKSQILVKFGKKWQKMAKIELWTPREERKIEI